MRNLEWLLHFPRRDLRRLAKNAGRYYRSFDIRFTPDSKWRHIDNPTEHLKCLQRRINRKLLQTVELPESMLGAVPKKSVQENMRLHAGQLCLARLDLRDCFPRTGPRQVFHVYRRIFGCSSEIARLLTQLTTFQHRVPQGAPSSPCIVNLSLLPLHAELRHLAEARGLLFSMWIDDVAVSGDPQAVTEFVDRAIGVIRSHSHSVRCKKVEVMPRNRPQRLTGGTLNRKVSAGHRVVKGIRDEVIRIARSGKVSEGKLQSIRGKIHWVAHCSPVQGRGLTRFADRYLPSVGSPGKLPRLHERRKCRRACKHARRPR